MAVETDANSKNRGYERECGEVTGEGCAGEKQCSKRLLALESGVE